MVKTMTKDQQIQALEKLVKSFARQTKEYSDAYDKTAAVLDEYRLVFDPIVDKIFNDSDKSKSQKQEALANDKRLKFLTSILKAYKNTLK